MINGPNDAACCTSFFFVDARQSPHYENDA